MNSYSVGKSPSEKLQISRTIENKTFFKSRLVNILLGLAVFGSSGSGFGRSKHL
jgi:hypothetical protein